MTQGPARAPSRLPHGSPGTLREVAQGQNRCLPGWQEADKAKSAALLAAHGPPLTAKGTTPPRPPVTQAGATQGRREWRPRRPRRRWALVAGDLAGVSSESSREAAALGGTILQRWGREGRNPHSEPPPAGRAGRYAALSSQPGFCLRPPLCPRARSVPPPHSRPPPSPRVARPGGTGSARRL